ncbi:MAG: toxin-antitoxin system YwqK family antitoxin [Bacteroidota bacterium]|nr:toxin-antitoxin system YwqK family antitoxin [Bacteroidota bacterium]
MVFNSQLFLFLSFFISLNLYAQVDDKKSVKRVSLESLENVNEIMYHKGEPFTGHALDYFSNKVKKQEMHFESGLLHGPKTEYFEGGILIRSKLYFTNGKRNGTFYFYHPNGKVKLTGKYINDELDSTVNAFYDNGNPKYTHNYKLGIKHGESLTYFYNGVLEQKVNLVNGIPSGFMRNFYQAGNLRQESFYTNGVRNGMFYKYHLTGVMAEESYYKNGLLDSVSRYFDNVFGRLMKEEYYKAGKRFGIQITYNELGDTITLMNYINDVLEGPYQKYYAGSMDFGKKKKSYKGYVHGLDEVGIYVNGKLNGEFKTGLINRKNRAEGTYKDGVMVGEWKYYNANDKLVLHEKYNENGELIYQKPKLKVED